MTQKKGFTLIELLVVIAIIALLLSISLPSLRRAREASKRALCLYNTKSLATCWMLYIQENDGRLPRGDAPTAPADTTENPVDAWIGSARDNNGELVREHVALNAPVENQLRAIRKGVLYQYVQSTDVYRCPIAKPTEMRTYSGTHAMNGNAIAESYGGKVIKRISDIRNTGGRIVYLDDCADDWDACWMIFNDRAQWWNTTPVRHGDGNVFSFADGHSEWWKWEDRRTIELARRCFEAGTPNASAFPDMNSNQPDNPDLRRIQRAIWGPQSY